ncbi:aromatic amino acid lyase, partial [Staphylococcus warneri]|uniref:aromatic amino acid lyase n=1 Tax=Staphylococcus warneri TaxID=1292 RepID=UPI001643D5DF
QKLDFQMNASNDNPLIFDEHRQTTVISPANFHPQPIPFPLHHFKLPLTQLPNLSQPRVQPLLNPQFNNPLPPFLTPQPGLQSGPMIMQYPPASLLSQNRT